MAALKVEQEKEAALKKSLGLDLTHKCDKCHIVMERFRSFDDEQYEKGNYKCAHCPFKADKMYDHDYYYRCSKCAKKICKKCMQVKSGVIDQYAVECYAMMDLGAKFSVQDNDYPSNVTRDYVRQNPGLDYHDSGFYAGKNFDKDDSPQQWFQLELEEFYVFRKFILAKKGYDPFNKGDALISKIRFEYSEDGENWTKCPDEFTTGQTVEDKKDHQLVFEIPTPFRAKKVRFFVTEKNYPKYGGRFDYIVSLSKDQELSVKEEVKEEIPPKTEEKKEEAAPSEDKPAVEENKKDENVIPKIEEPVSESKPEEKPMVDESKKDETVKNEELISESKPEEKPPAEEAKKDETLTDPVTESKPEEKPSEKPKLKEALEGLEEEKISEPSEQPGVNRFMSAGDYDDQMVKNKSEPLESIKE